MLISKSTFSKNSFRNTSRVSSSLEPDQARQNVGPDLGPNCLQGLSADNTSRQRVKCGNLIWVYTEWKPMMHKMTVCDLLKVVPENKHHKTHPILENGRVASFF